MQLDLSKIMYLEIKGNYMKKQGLIIMLILLSLLLPIFGPDVSIGAQALTTLEVYRARFCFFGSRLFGEIFVSQ